MGQSGLDSHKAFTVSYQLDGDRELAYHFDNSEVTLNVCLGTSFTGGELSFGPMTGVSVHYNNIHGYIIKVGILVKEMVSIGMGTCEVFHFNLSTYVSLVFHYFITPRHKGSTCVVYNQ